MITHYLEVFCLVLGSRWFSSYLLVLGFIFHCQWTYCELFQSLELIEAALWPPYDECARRATCTWKECEFWCRWVWWCPIYVRSSLLYSHLTDLFFWGSAYSISYSMSIKVSSILLHFCFCVIFLFAYLELCYWIYMHA